MCTRVRGEELVAPATQLMRMRRQAVTFSMATAMLPVTMLTLVELPSTMVSVALILVFTLALWDPSASLITLFYISR